ncbi:hypothetical protein AB0368_07440 [Actinoplanes sp. NPDC051475]|uniref:hypothetical protein n=1 Tax=Actinoplanes sp. NPDC051475 TaxID=3157225 RepID=UPI00344C7F55
MGFPERRADPDQHAYRPDDRYGTKPGPRNAGSHEPLAFRDHTDPVDPPPAPARTDLTQLLGRTVLEVRVQQICQEYGLIPRTGAAVGSGLSRSYLARESGVELAADAHGVVTAIFLHFHGDNGFSSYRGEIPGGAGSVPRRAALWASLGRPEESGDPYRDRFLGDYGPWDVWALEGFDLHAQYSLDGEAATRVTLTLPDPQPFR